MGVHWIVVGRVVVEWRKAYVNVTFHLPPSTSGFGDVGQERLID